MSAGEGIGMVKDKTPFTGGKHAFLIMAHKDDETLRTLLRTLDDPRNDIFIHMDSKSIAWDENSVLTSISKARIFPVPRISATWGGLLANRLRAQLAQRCRCHGALLLLSSFEWTRPSHQEPGSNSFFL